MDALEIGHHMVVVRVLVPGDPSVEEEACLECVSQELYIRRVVL
eukprot:CAMPEP_0196652738 /NCGR_PEP_ID=MMETSP1086-20130531/2140_1 /TAXON_ID=77921 /ORGANISM="Cyanoptyche  gloeocystis , Strain SAG4.97" /LENGTH=43 /DNA_ID= /DNA_START= /DNA_END= /DNA_ORIENTATION=